MSGVVSDTSPLIALSLMTAIREPIDTLRAGGFRVATELYERVLTKAGELR